MIGMKNTYKSVGEYLDHTTGEITEVFENEKFVHQSAKETNMLNNIRYKKMFEERNIFENLIMETFNGFYMYFYDAGLDSVPIKEGYKLRFLVLCTYTNYSEKGLYLTYENGVRMKKDGIAKILNITPRECNNMLEVFIDHGLLTPFNEFYNVSKEIIHRGTMSRKQKKELSTRVFDKGVRELYRNCDISQHKQLYYLFKLLAYVNIEHNIVCQNPTENCIEDVIPLKIQEICECVGYNKNQATRLKKELYSLRVFDEFAFVGVESEYGMWFKINPRIIYAGRSKNIDGLNRLIEALNKDFRVNLNARHFE